MGITLSTNGRRKISKESAKYCPRDKRGRPGNAGENIKVERATIPKPLCEERRNLCGYI